MLLLYLIRWSALSACVKPRASPGTHQSGFPLLLGYVQLQFRLLLQSIAAINPCDTLASSAHSSRHDTLSTHSTSRLHTQRVPHRLTTAPLDTQCDHGMAARAALGRALLASGTTIVGLGAATMLVSSVSMGVAKVVVTENKVRLLL